MDREAMDFEDEELTVLETVSLLLTIQWRLSTLPSVALRRPRRRTRIRSRPSPLLRPYSTPVPAPRVEGLSDIVAVNVVKFWSVYWVWFVLSGLFHLAT